MNNMNKADIKTWLTTNQDPDPELFAYRLLDLVEGQRVRAGRFGWFKEWTGTALTIVGVLAAVAALLVFLVGNQRDITLRHELEAFQQQSALDIKECQAEKARVDGHVTKIVEALKAHHEAE